MSKYGSLGEYLSQQQADFCMLTFSQVEEIIGASLPASAKRRSWWANDESHVQARSWMRSGWRVRRPRLEKGIVHFVRVGEREGSSAEHSSGKGSSQVIVRGLDAEIVVQLKRKAKRKGCSLEQELRNILRRAAVQDRGDLLAEADRIRAMSPGIQQDSVQLLREDRDSR